MSQKSKGIYRRKRANASKVSLEFAQGEITTGKQRELKKENKEWRKNMLKERDRLLKCLLGRRLRLVKQFSVPVFLCGCYS